MLDALTPLCPFRIPVRCTSLGKWTWRAPARMIAGAIRAEGEALSTAGEWRDTMSDDGWYKYLNAKDDWAKTDEDSPVAINVLANDVGAHGIVKVNGKPVTADTPPLVLTSGATVDLDGTTLLYDPDSAFQTLNTGQSAWDKFSYTVSGSGRSTDTADVKVTIAGKDEAQPDANRPPVAADDKAEVPVVINSDLSSTFPRSVKIDVRANDKDPEGSPLKVATIAGTKVDTDPATDLPDTVTLDKGTATVTLNADGSLTYAEVYPDFELEFDFDFEIEGYELNENGELVPVDGGEPVLLDPDPISPSLPNYFDPWPINSFTYTATDDNGAESNAATVTIYEQFQGLDVEPVAVGDPTDPWLM